MIIITGTKRSCTSAMMCIMRDTFGDVSLIYNRDKHIKEYQKYEYKPYKPLNVLEVYKYNSKCVKIMPEALLQMEPSPELTIILMKRDPKLVFNSFAKRANGALNQIAEMVTKEYDLLYEVYQMHKTLVFDCQKPDFKALSYYLGVWVNVNSWNHNQDIHEYAVNYDPMYKIYDKIGTN